MLTSKLKATPQLLGHKVNLDLVAQARVPYEYWKTSVIEVNADHLDMFFTCGWTANAIGLKLMDYLDRLVTISVFPLACLEA